MPAANLCAQQPDFEGVCCSEGEARAVAGVLVGGDMGPREPQLPPARRLTEAGVERAR
jgi:hypothetical protein